MGSSAFVDKVADKITSLGLTTPAILLLEAHKPLAFMGSQLLLVAQPTFDILFPANAIRHTANLLADSDQLESLILKLEQRAAAAPSEKNAL